MTASVTNNGVNVWNNVNLTRSEIAVLSLGFSFIPHPNHRRQWSDTLAKDYTNFERNVRIKHHFKYELSNAISPETLLHTFINQQRNKLINTVHSFTPPKASPVLELYLKQVKHNLLNLSQQTDTKQMYYSRLLHNHWKPFYNTVLQLKTRKDIVIFPSDKNMGPTILSREFYIQEGESTKQLGDTTAYTVLDNTSLNIEHMFKTLREILSKQSWLSKKEANQLYDDFTVFKDNIQPCKAYFLPKVHKQDQSLRLICASCSWLTYLPSKYIAFTLKPILKSLPSYIEDSASLVKLLTNLKTSVFDQLITADVKTLYPAIVIKDGLQSLHQTLVNKGWDKNHITFIIELTSWVLHNNVLTFNGKLYLQIKGTAMGTPLAVAYACIHMHVIERESFAIFTARGRSLRNILLYVRFIDDIHFVATNYDDAKLLLDIINNRRPSIKLEFNIRNSKVDFLDITIFKADKVANLQVKIFQKPGNKFLFLPPMSFHPPHIFRGWISGYIKRMRLNCSQDQDFLVALSQFKSQLLTRGYTNAYLEDLFEPLPLRQDLLTNLVKKTTTTGVPFVTTYTAEVDNNKKQLKTALSVKLDYDEHPDIEYILCQRNRPLLALKRESNLRALLVTAKL